MQRITKLQQLLQSILETPEGMSISVYEGKLSTQIIIDNVKRIKKAFPALPEGFYDVLAERITDNTFTDDRLTDAVKNVIDTCVYPQPTIAQFISFDKRIKILTYEDMIRKTDEVGDWIWKHYKPIQLPDRETKCWIHIDDIKKYNIQDE